MQYTAEQIQANFDKLSPEVQQAITSPEVHDKVQLVGKEHNRLIDQMGELVDEIGLVLLGLHRSKDFVDNISKRLGISNSDASAIAQSVNKEVFDTIKEHLKEQDRNIINNSAVDEIENSYQINNKDISTLERVGGFTVEPPANLPTDDTKIGSRASVLSQLEDPAPSPEHSYPKNKEDEIFTEPLVDHLLSNPTANTEEKVEKTDEKPKEKPPTPPRKSGPDPYREPIK